MKRTAIILTVFLTILATIKIIYHQGKVKIHDGFEGTELSGLWSRSRMEPGSYEIQSSVVRKGEKALKLTLKYGDIVEYYHGKGKDTERDELLERRYYYAIEDERYEYKFSLFLPDSFPIVPVRLVIAQWKQDCPFCSCDGYSPVVAIRYISGRLFITVQTDSLRKELYSTTEEVRGKWMDFRFIMKFSRDTTGLIITYLNGKKIVSYKGLTSYKDNCRVLSSKNKYYFKTGLYRDRMNEPMVIYIDEYSKRKLGKEEVLSDDAGN